MDLLEEIPSQDAVASITTDVVSSPSIVASSGAKKRKGRPKKKKTFATKATALKSRAKKPARLGADGKRKRRFRPGTVALRQIRKEQQRTDLRIQKAPFVRLIREILGDTSNGEYMITEKAKNTIQSAAEEHVTDALYWANRVAIHGGRVQITPADLAFAVKIRNDDRT